VCLHRASRHHQRRIRVLPFELLGSGAAGPLQLSRDNLPQDTPCSTEAQNHAGAKVQSIASHGGRCSEAIQFPLRWVAAFVGILTWRLVGQYRAGHVPHAHGGHDPIRGYMLVRGSLGA
jgi:hypothetical protein